VPSEIARIAPAAVPVVMHDDGSLWRSGQKIEPGDVENYLRSKRRIPENAEPPQRKP